MRTLARLAAILILGSAAPFDAQQKANPRITVADERAVTPSGGATLFVEPHIAVHPRNPNHLVVAAMEFGKDQKEGVIGVHVSTDGGATWTRGRFSGSTAGADPWLGFDDTGIGYLLQIGGREPSADTLWRSDDGGRTWQAHATLPRENGGPYDYTKLVIDGSGGTPRLVILAAQTGIRAGTRKIDTVVLLTSADGKTFDRRPVLMTDVNHQNGVPAVTSSGSIIVPFHELSYGRSLLAAPRLWAVVADRTGAISTAALVADNFMADSPFFVADTTRSTFHDRVYGGWMGLAGDFNHYLVHSTDGGIRWTRPLRVNDSKETKRIPTHHPMMAVAPGGTLGMSWYDARDDETGKCFRLYFTASTDGGVSVLPNVPVSAVNSCPDVEGNRIPVSQGSSLTALRRFKEGGDYHGLVALPDGGFRVVWSDSRDGSYQLRTARIRLDKP